MTSVTAAASGVRPNDIAIVGMACRFPGASNYMEYWDNLQRGVESVLVDPPSSSDEPGTVRARSHLPGIDLFDAEFFGFTPREAELLDPQHRLFLECSWEALEEAGLAGPFRVPVGVFGGMAMSTYLLNNITAGTDPKRGRTFLESITELQMAVASDRDYLTSRVSYKLDLRGPSLNVQAACATSLFAVHLASQAILNGECDIALAGAANIPVPQSSAYLYEAGLVFSDDGHCRPFDAKARGTVFGSGVGVVVMKLASQAMADGDDIHAIIRGTAVNNDGASKAGFLAPGTSGQVAVVKEALAVADVHPRTVSYVEAHGTGTIVGDAIEIAALRECFVDVPRGTCGIGSVKSNLGHLAWAAGMASLIKVVLSLKHQEIPASLNFDEPSPALDLQDTPFYVVSKNRAWPAGDSPRRAGVSAFGLGGANAHIVLQEPPPVMRPADEEPRDSERLAVLVLSARSPAALKQTAERLATAIADVDAPVQDVALTLGRGRTHHQHRLAVTAISRSAASAALRRAAQDLAEQAGAEREGVYQGQALGRPVIAAMFTGQGAEYVGMGRDLYLTEPVFAKTIDESDEVLGQYLRKRTAAALFDGPRRRGDPIRSIAQAQPLVFAVQMALLRLYQSWGIEPSIVIGHSLGEYAAACAAGVFDFPTGLRLVAERGRLIQTLPETGAMAVLFASQETLQSVLDEIDGVSVAAINGERNIVISGDRGRIATACSRIEATGVSTRLLKIPRAGHSPLMDPILDDYERVVSQVKLAAPSIRLVSNLSGRMAGIEVTEPSYWRRQLREPVQFLAGLRTLASEGANVLAELGAGPVLTAMAGETLDDPDRRWLPTLQRDRNDRLSTRMAAAAAYVAGVQLNWGELAGGNARKMHLPTYPFQRQSFWVGPAIDSPAPAQDMDRLLRVAWAPPQPTTDSPTAPSNRRVTPRWLVLGPDIEEGKVIAAELRRRGVLVDVAAQDDPDVALGFTSVLDLRGLAATPTSSADPSLGEALRSALEPFMNSARRLVATSRQVKWFLLSRGGECTALGEVADPVQAALRAAARVVSMENPGLDLMRVDLPGAGGVDPKVLCELLLGMATTAEAEVAIRSDRVLVRRLIPHDISVGLATPTLDPSAVHLVTGGLGGLGLRAAETLVRGGAHRVALLGRTPARADAGKTIDGLRAAGADLSTHTVDICDEAALEGLLDELIGLGDSLGTIIHCAGQIDDAPVEAMTWSRIAAVLGPKVLGLANLLRACRRRGLTPASVVLYSSTTAIFGNAGQFNHAAANGCLDAAATELRASGVPAVSVAWGPWRGVGHLANSQRLIEQLAAQGERSLGPEEGDAALARLLQAPLAHAVVANFDWPTFAAQRAPQEARLVENLVGTAPRSRAAASDSTPADLLHASDSEERTQLVADHIVRGLARIIGTPECGADQIHHSNLFDAVGLDSLSATQLRNWLQRTLRCQLPARAVYDHPSVALLAQFLARNILDDEWITTARGVAARVDDSSQGGAWKVGSAIPLSVQQRRWLRLIRDIGYGRRVVPIVIRRSLEPEALRRALVAVVHAHEALRTRFPGGEAEILPAEAVVPQQIPTLHLVGVSAPERRGRVSEAVNEARQALGDPFDQPSWTVRCIETSDTEFVLLIGLQHLEFDGSSLEIFAADVLDAYDGWRERRRCGLPPATPYRAYAAERAALREETMATAGPFFEALFEAVPRPTTLPGHPGFERTKMLASRRFTPESPLATWESLTHSASVHGCSPFSLILGSYAELIGDLTGEPTVTVSIIRSARDDERWARTIGPFTSPFPVPITVAGRAGAEVARHVHRQTAAITARTAFPVTELPALTLAFKSMPMDSYFSDIGINFINYRRRERDDARVLEILGSVDHADFVPDDFAELGRIPGLHLVAYVLDGEVSANYWYHEARFSADQVSEWAEHHRRLLNKVLTTDPASKKDQ